MSKAEDYRKQAEKKVGARRMAHPVHVHATRNAQCNSPRAHRYHCSTQLKSFSFFGSKHEEAADLYEKAANNFKLGKCWNDAADCYEKLADLQIKLESKHEAATALVEASKCAAKSQPEKATAILHKAISIYTDMGRLNQAARQLKEVAEINEKQGLKEESIQFYEQAADLFETDNSTSEASKCKLKIAEFAAELGQYKRSVELYEGEARRAVENNLLKFSARGYLLNATICYMCFCSPDDLEIKVAKYKDLDLQLRDSREAMLMDQMLESFQHLDNTSVKRFEAALAEFDRMIRLDAWRTKILLVVKKRLESMAEGGEDDSEEDVQ